MGGDGEDGTDRLEVIYIRVEMLQLCPLSLTVKKPECFHYRTHYCSAMTVATYLIRMEPYTQHYLHLQVRVRWWSCDNHVMVM